MPGPLSHIRGILRNVLRDHHLEPRLAIQRVLIRWPELVGEQVARHAWPTGVRFHRLHIVVDSPVWLQQLTFLKASILERLRREEADAQIQDVVLKIGPFPEPMTSVDEAMASPSGPPDPIQPS